MLWRALSEALLRTESGGIITSKSEPKLKSYRNIDMFCYGTESIRPWHRFRFSYWLDRRQFSACICRPAVQLLPCRSERSSWLHCHKMQAVTV